MPQAPVHPTEEEGGEKEEEEKPSRFSKSPLYEIKNSLTIVLTITGIILAGIAYGELKAISSDVFDIIDNWKTEPVIEIYIADYNVGCRSGFDRLGHGHADFAGLQRGHCGCTPNSLYTSTYPNCSDAAEVTDFCMTAPARGAVSAKAWRRESICIKRGAQAAAKWNGGYERRPYPTNKGCPDGYKLCGSGKYVDGERAICSPTDDVCPITGILIAPDDDPPTSGGWVKANGSFAVEAHSLYYRREYPNELPVIDFKTALTEYKSDDYLTDEYRPSKNSRGECYIGKGQKFSSSIAVSDYELAAYSESTPARCKRTDKRYVMWDKARLDEVWLGNLEKNSDCSAFDLYPLDHPSFVASDDADYLQSGVPCGSGKYVCDRPDFQITTCDGSDPICDLVINQNVCGQYVQAVRDLSDSDISFGLYRRSEIIWEEACEVNQDQIYTSQDPLTAALDAQLAVVIITSVLGAFTGVIWPILMLTYLKSTHYNKISSLHLMDYFDPVTHLLKLAPTIASVIMIGKIYKLYASAGKDKCSDDLTNETFDFLAEKLPEIYSKSVVTLVMEIILMLMGGYFLRSKLKKERKRKLKQASVAPAPPPVIQPVEHHVVNATAGVQMMPQQPGYASQQPGYSPQQQIYAPQQPGFAAQQPGYAPQQQAYAPQQQVYAPQQQIYAPQQAGYAPQQQIYAPQQPGYAPQQPGYAPQQPGYAPQQPGYAPQQPGYAPQQPGNASQQPGYAPQQPGYAPQQPGYAPQQPGYAPQQPGYAPQQQG